MQNCPPAIGYRRRRLPARKASISDAGGRAGSSKLKINKCKYQGIAIEESLKDNRVVNALNVVGVKISNKDRWHMYTIFAVEKDIKVLSRNIKQGWYAHFWKGKKVIAVFKGRKFEFDYGKKATWQPAIEHGLFLGIPKEQLDFPIK